MPRRLVLASAANICLSRRHADPFLLFLAVLECLICGTFSVVLSSHCILSTPTYRRPFACTTPPAVIVSVFEHTTNRCTNSALTMPAGGVRGLAITKGSKAASAIIPEDFMIAVFAETFMTEFVIAVSLAPLTERNRSIYIPVSGCITWPRGSVRHLRRRD